ncbi:hypothetical protein F8M41_014755 [Gigaspora margarita]|uniref:Uncharacterized protein n=1 Tax=Gigaspora margarita TaxID=4874 RepID=A0A8H4ENP6_GIGMA|nr:hypothetical protein F8M41_014755 [Gigaspora margarita]
MYARDDKVNDLEIETEKEENFNTNDAPESEGPTLNLIKNLPEMTLANVVLGKDRNLAPDTNQKFADMDHYGIGGYCYRKEVGVEKNKNKASIYHQNPIDMKLDKETSGLDCHIENRTGDKDGYRGLYYACERWKMKVNEFLRKDSEGERQNKENYYLNDLGRPNIIAVQTENRTYRRSTRRWNY